jgi:pimeloyl-ACP methyl ester carboxylesterase
VHALILGGASHRPQNGALDRIIYPGFVDTIETEGIESFLQQWSARLGRALDPDVRAVVVGNDPRVLLPYLRQLDSEPGFDNENLSRIRRPVLLFAGEHDHERLADSRAAAAIVPGAELFVLADADHESTPRRVFDIVPRVEAFLDPKS